VSRGGGHGVPMAYRDGVEGARMRRGRLWPFYRWFTWRWGNPTVVRQRLGRRASSTLTADRRATAGAVGRRKRGARGGGISRRLGASAAWGRRAVPREGAQPWETRRRGSDGEGGRDARGRGRRRGAGRF
jgi:hypothetical protein